MRAHRLAIVRIVRNVAVCGAIALVAYILVGPDAWGWSKSDYPPIAVFPFDPHGAHFEFGPFRASGDRVYDVALSMKYRDAKSGFACLYETEWRERADKCRTALDALRGVSWTVSPPADKIIPESDVGWSRCYGETLIVPLSQVIIKLDTDYTMDLKIPASFATISPSDISIIVDTQSLNNKFHWEKKVFREDMYCAITAIILVIIAVWLQNKFIR